MSKKQFIKPILKSKEILENKFPGIPVLTLSEIKEKSAKMVSLNEEAIDILNLKEREGFVKFGITRGYVDGLDSEIVPFIFGTSEDSADILSDAGNIVNRATATFHFNTGNARSATYHDVLTNHHWDKSNDEKHFVLVEEYTDGYWRLDPMSITDSNEEETITMFAQQTETEVEMPDVEITLG